MRTHFVQRCLTIYSVLSILLQSCIPFISLSPQIALAQGALKNTISYNSDKGSFHFELNNTDASLTSGTLLYSLLYRNEASAHIENVNGSTTLADVTFARDIEAGTCSGEVCVRHTVEQGIIKVKIEGGANWFDSQWFKIQDGTLSIVQESITGSIDAVSQEENAWLNTGVSTQPLSITPPVYPTLFPTITPTIVPPSEITPTSTIDSPQLPDNEVVSAQVVKVDGSYVDPVFAASTWTDKLDYAPTEKVVITGKNFTATKNYTISISSHDEPSVTFNDTFTTTPEGVFSYEYQLDGNYRPSYAVEIKDGNISVASTTFTDSRSINVASVSGGATTTVTPDSSVGGSITVNTTGSGTANNWQSTKYTVEGRPSVCVNHSDHTSSGTYTENFTITAPHSVGTYDVSFIAYDNNSCSSGASSTYTLTNAIVVITDSTAPTVPGTPTTSSPTNNTKPTWTWSASTDGGTGLAATPYTLEWSQSPTFSSGVFSATSSTHSFTHITALADGTWYFRVRATDVAGNTSVYSENGVVVIDTTAPTVSISSSSSNPTNTNPIPVTITFSEPVIGFTVGDITVTNGTKGILNGSGLVYTINITPTGGAVSVHIAATVATDAAGNSNTASNTLSRTYDATAPTISINNPNSSPAQSKTITASSNEGTLMYSVNAPGISTCDSLLTFVSYVSKTFSSESDNGKTVCYKAFDGAGNTSYLLSHEISGIDRTAPTVVNVTSSTPNGAYATGNSISINVQFSEIVDVTGFLVFYPVLQLETGSTDRYATYASGSGTDTLSFSYLVKSGDVSSDLDYLSSSALDLFILGTIKDKAGNDATLTLSTPGSPHSLSGNKNILIDTTIPTLSLITPVSTPTNSTTPSFTLHSTESGFLTYGGLCTSNTQTLISGNTTITFSALTEGTYTNCTVQIADAAGNKSGVLLLPSFTIDTTSPTVILVFPTPGPSATFFQVVFSENVVQAEAENPANYALHNWPGAGGSGPLIGEATVVYIPSIHTATITFSNPGWYISPEQEWAVQDVHDLAGNGISPNPTSAYSTPLVNPVTTDLGTDDNWHNSAVTVSFICTDSEGSGCKRTYYTTDGTTPTTASSYGDSVTLNADGEYHIQYFSEDNAGNSETVKSASHIVKIDKTSPTGTVTYSETAYTNSDVQATLHTSEATTVTNNGGNTVHTFSTNGDFVFEFVDKAGNTGTVTASVTNIDTTPPSVPVASPSAGDYTSDQIIYLTSSDTESGIDAIYYTIDGSVPDKTSSFYSGSILADKDITIKAIAYDKAGNASGVLEASYGIPPHISSEAEVSTTFSTATITWLTDDASTSRVVYDTVSHPVLGLLPNYGYANSTIEDIAKVLSHAVSLTGLTTGTTYYYRVISHGSPEAIGLEKSFSISCTASIPHVPGPLSLTRLNDSEVKVTWGAAADPVTGYKITWSKDTDIDGDGDGSQTVGKVTESTISGLNLNKYGYYFKVRGINECSVGDPDGVVFIGAGQDLRTSTSSTPTPTPSSAVPFTTSNTGLFNGPNAQSSEKVLGTNTLTPTPTPNPTGSILGTTAPSNNKAIWWWPWILLLLLPPLWYGYKKWKKNRP